MSGPALDLAGLVVGIWGFGLEGRSIARRAAHAGAARIDAVHDAGHRTLDVPRDVPRLTVHHGAEQLELLAHCDVVFISPGVPWAHPVFAELRASGIRLSSAADWFVTRNAARTIGVTGTKGKSTTAAFLGHLLNSLGVRTVVAGNIGTPLPDLPDDDALVVAELSSQQAALLSTSPALAIVTNLYEDHLDWHGGVDAYYRAKANVFGHGAAALVTTAQTVATLERVGVTTFPDLVLVTAPAPMPNDAPGPMDHEHNRLNGALAVAAAERHLGRALTAAEVDAARRTFGGLPHRLQVVRRTDRIRWIDDTLATTGESVVAALKSMPREGVVALIVGGMDRGLDYRQVDQYLCGASARVTLIQAPTNGPLIGCEYAARYPERVRVAATLDEAVRLAAAVVDVDVVLLSPGAASYDLYANYEAKATAFCASIDGLTGDPPDEVRAN